MIKSNYTLNLGGELFSLKRPWVMGILNITPDSFYADSRWNSVEHAVERARVMLEEGADILDLGGQSTRPGANRIDSTEEANRVIPVIKAILDAFPDCKLSIDTFYGAVARQAIEAGAVMVNDVSAGSLDPSMFSTVAELGVPYVLMHMQGEPQTMQHAPQYAQVTSDIIHYFSGHIRTLRSLGVKDIILDPGFGFGKTLEHNYTLLRELEQLQLFSLPVLAGISRKKMIQRALDVDADEALTGTIAANTMALMHGASILRVHDVREAVQTVRMVEALNQGAE